MLEQLIKKSKSYNLHLLQVLLVNKENTLDTLANTLVVSKSSLKRFVADINIDLAQSATIDCQVIKKNDSYTLSYQNNTEPATIYHSLKLMYLNESVSFRLLIKLILDSHTDINSLIDSLYISHSHFYRTLTSLTNFLNQFGLSLGTIKGKLQITGDEMLIRSTLLVIITSVYQSNHWPFNVSKEQITNTFGFVTLTKDYPQSVQYQCLYLLALTDNRLKKKHFLSNLYTIEFMPILNILSEEHDLTAPFLKFPPNSSLDDELTRRERELFNFILRLIVANLDSPAQKKTIGLRWIATSNPITDYCLKFCTLFFSHYSLPETDENYAEFMFFSVLYHIAALYPQAQIVNMTNIDHQLPNITDYSVEIDEISTLYTTFSTSYYLKNSRKVAVKPDFIQFFSQLSFLFLQAKQTKILTIYVYYSQNILSENFIKEKLLSNFSSESLLFITNPSEADIIISDSTYDKTTSGKHFYIPSVFDVNALQAMFSFIQTCLFNKNFTQSNE